MERLDAHTSEITAFLRKEGVDFSTPVDIQFKDETATIRLNNGRYILVCRKNGKLIVWTPMPTAKKIVLHLPIGIGKGINPSGPHATE